MKALSVCCMFHSNLIYAGTASFFSQPGDSGKVSSIVEDPDFSSLLQFSFTSAANLHLKADLDEMRKKISELEVENAALKRVFLNSMGKSESPLSSTTCTATRTADLVCANSARPRTALCLHGQPRTLSHPLVYRTVRSFVIEAFGGDFTSFASLNMPAAGTDHWYLSEQNDEAVKAALDHIGVSEQNRRLVYNVSANQSLPPQCGHSPSTDPKYHGHFVGTAVAVSNRASCMQLIEADEKRTTRPFDFVLLQRADLMWLRPMSPHCLLNAKLQSILMVNTDQVLLMPRNAASIAAKQLHSDFLDCSNLYAPDDYEELYLLRYIEKKKLSFVANDGSIDAYPLRSAAQQENAQAQLKEDVCILLAPGISDCKVDLPQVTFLNMCNQPVLASES